MTLSDLELLVRKMRELATLHGYDNPNVTFHDEKMGELASALVEPGRVFVDMRIPDDAITNLNQHVMFTSNHIGSVGDYSIPLRVIPLKKEK